MWFRSTGLSNPTFRARIDAKAKPPGSLGRIEDLAVQLGMIWHPHVPQGGRAALLICAADHGLTRAGVSKYPSEVTAAMVQTFLAGRASANAFASACGVDVHVVDAGVAADLDPHPRADLCKDRARHGECRGRACNVERGCGRCADTRA